MQKFRVLLLDILSFSSHHGWIAQFRSHQRDLVINRRRLDPPQLRHNEALFRDNQVFFRLLVTIPGLSCFFLASSDHFSPDTSALGIQVEYIFNSKLQSSFFLMFGNHCLHLNLHCDSCCDGISTAWLKQTRGWGHWQLNKHRCTSARTKTQTAYI